MSSTTIVRLIEVEATAPSLQDNTGDLDRLVRQVEVKTGQRPRVPFAAMSSIAAKFRQATFKGWVLVNDAGSVFEIIDFMATKPKVLPAMALDLGTTHLEA